MLHMTADQPRSPQYPPPPKAVPRRAIIALVVLVVMCLLAGWWTSTRIAAEKVTYKLLGFSKTDDQTLAVEYLITNNSGKDVTCTIQAYNKQYSVIGLSQDVAPDTGGVTKKRIVQVKLREAPLTADVTDCTH